MTEKLTVVGSPPFIPNGWPLDPARWDLFQHSLYAYEFWPRPGLADVPLDVEPWAWDSTTFWTKPISMTAEVDVARTKALSDPAWNVPGGVGAGNFWDGQVYGHVYQHAQTKGPDTVVWDDSRQASFWDIIFGRAAAMVTTRIPYPTINGAPFVRTEGDPNPGLNDRHSIVIAPGRKRLYESINMRPNILGAHGASHVAHVTEWDTSKRWQATPGGVVAAKIPLFGLLVRRDEVIAGNIDHVQGLVMDRYNRAIVGPARGGDGLSTLHPVRSGERLRFTLEATRRLLNKYKGNVLAEAQVRAGRTYGFIVMDKSTENADVNGRGRVGITMAQEHFFADKGWAFQLNDLEIVNW